MNLPNYFLADLPAGATLSPALVTEACQSVRRNRAKYIAGLSTAAVIRVLHTLGESWLDDDYPFRQMALSQGPLETGFSRPTLARGLDSFFQQLNGENLETLVNQELGHALRLDTLVSSPLEQRGQRAALASGPELLVHVAGGQIPNPALTSIVLGLLVRSAQFIKCASGAALLPRLFAHSLYDAEPKLGSCIEIAEWCGGNAALESALFAEADCVTAIGSDETLAAIRRHLPPRVRFLGYGHRVSFGYITKDALSSYGTKKLVSRAAADVIAWDQLGCLSPHVFYAEEGGHVTPEQFAEQLAAELARREASEPRGRLSTEAAAAIASRRSLYEVRAAHSPETTRHWCSPDSTAWTVIYEADPQFQLSCLSRFIYVKAVKQLAEALHGAGSVFGKISTVGLAAPLHRAEEIALKLARWGVPRVCPLGQMQSPPLTWRHDGRPSLGDLVTWTDWEQ
jgi:hypothetical protein